MSLRTIAVCILLFFSLFGILFIYVLDHPVEGFIEKVNEVAEFLPGVVFLLGFIYGATKLQKGKVWMVIGGVILSIAGTVILWTKYLKEVIERIENTTKYLDNKFYISLAFFVLILAIVALNPKRAT
jgi:hypothetical protein